MKTPEEPHQLVRFLFIRMENSRRASPVGEVFVYKDGVSSLSRSSTVV
jgi:hypothetical protein